MFRRMNKIAERIEASALEIYAYRGICMEETTKGFSVVEAARPSPSSRAQGTRKSGKQKHCKKTQLTICNRQPSVLLLHLEFALALLFIHILFI